MRGASSGLAATLRTSRSCDMGLGSNAKTSTACEAACSAVKPMKAPKSIIRRQCGSTRSKKLIVPASKPLVNSAAPCTAIGSSAMLKPSTRTTSLRPIWTDDRRGRVNERLASARVGGQSGGGDPGARGEVVVVRAISGHADAADDLAVDADQYAAGDRHHGAIDRAVHRADEVRPLDRARTKRLRPNAHGQRAIRLAVRDVV